MDMFKLYTRPMFTQLVFVPSLVQIRTEKDAKEDNVENLSVTQTRVIRLQIVIKLEANGSWLTRRRVQGRPRHTGDFPSITVSQPLRKPQKRITFVS